MSKQIRFSAFWGGQEHKEETAEMSTLIVEAEPENPVNQNQSCQSETFNKAG